MSGWDAWIEALCSPLPTGGAIGAGAIISLEGDVWGKSDSFPEISAEEALAVAQGFDNSDKLAEKGIFVGGIKYMFVQGVPGSIIRGVRSEVIEEETEDDPGKKIRHSLVAKKTNTGFVVGLFSDEGDLRKEPANSHIETVADALIDAGI